MHGLGHNELMDKVYRVVVEKPERCRVSTTLRKFHEAIAKAGVTLPDFYTNRAEAEEALVAIEDAMESLGYNLVTRVQYSDRVRVF